MFGTLTRIFVVAWKQVSITNNFILLHFGFLCEIDPKLIWNNYDELMHILA